MTFKVTLLWAETPDPGDEAKTYEFQTQAELDAFMKGVDEAAGWLGVRHVPEGFVVPEEGWDDELDDEYPNQL